MKKKTIQMLGIAVGLLAIQSCTKDEPTPNPEPTAEGYAQGVWITNEGSFNASNGSVSWMLLDSNRMENNVFASANGRPLGDIVQSAAKVGTDKMALVVNNSQKVEVVSATDGKSIYTITGLSYPRYAISDESFLYVSNGSFAGHVFVYEAESGAFQDSIAVGGGPERMGISNGKLFVANSGGFGKDSTVSVIDLASREVIETVQVGDLPTDVSVDANGDVWVMCRGKAIFDPETFEEVDATEAQLIRISGISNQVEYSVQIGEKFDHPREVEVNKVEDGIFFVLNKRVYQGFLDGTELSGQDILSINGFSGLGLTENNEVYVTETSDFTNPSNVRVYNTSGELLFQEEAGIAPNGFVFY